MLNISFGYFRKESISRTILLFVYSAIVIVVSLFHEWWRDEWRAVNIVTSSNSIAAFISLLKQEGHPPLWYFLIKLAWSVHQDHISVTLLHLLIVISSANVFIFRINYPISYNIAIL
jgi:hypothetical protein